MSCARWGLIVGLCVACSSSPTLPPEGVALRSVGPDGAPRSVGPDGAPRPDGLDGAPRLARAPRPDGALDEVEADLSSELSPTVVSIATNVPLPDANGEVVRVPLEKVPSVVFQIAFYAGSIDDPVGKEGLTRLAARLMLEGGTALLSYSELLERLYPWAAEIGVRTDKEQTVFYGRVHPDHAEQFLPLLIEVIMRPRFDPDAFTRVRENQLNDLAMRLRATDDANLGRALLDQLIYGETHPYGHHPAGSSMGLAAITLEDVKAHVDAVFGRRRLVIGIGGAFTAEHESALTQAFRDLPEGTRRPPRVPAGELPETNQMLIATKPNARAVAISMGFPHAVRRGHADWPALLVVQSFLGDQPRFHGLLMEQLREKRGLDYGDRADAETHRPEAHRRARGDRLPMINVARRQQHFEIRIQPVAPEDAALSIRLVLLYLDRLVKDGMPEKDFRRTVRFLRSNTRLWSATPMRRLGHAIDDHFYGTTDYIQELREALARLTVEDVNSAIRTHLRSQPLFIAAVASDAPSVLEGLRTGGLIRKTYPTRPGEEVLRDDEAAIRADVLLSDDDVRVLPVEYAFVR